MKNANEIYGHPIDATNDKAKRAFSSFSCRFTGEVCDKQSRMIDYPMGVCSVDYSDKKPIICPHRFLEDGLVFKNIALDAFGTLDNILLFKEVGLTGVGTFDFVLVKHKPISSKVEDFCTIEFQSDSTTGTGKLIQAVKDFTKGNYNKDSSYAFGMNTYNTIKLSYIQMLTKGQVMETWNKKIFWVMQDFVFDNMTDRFDLSDMNFDKENQNFYHIYDLVKKDNLYKLEG